MWKLTVSRRRMLPGKNMRNSKENTINNSNTTKIVTMKKTISVIAGLFMATAIFAQSEKYIKAMEALVPAVDTTRSEEGLIALANSFDRIANAEKTQWLPFYYSALCQVNVAN